MKFEFRGTVNLLLHGTVNQPKILPAIYVAPLFVSLLFTTVDDANFPSKFNLEHTCNERQARLFD